MEGCVPTVILKLRRGGERESKREKERERERYTCESLPYIHYIINLLVKLGLWMTDQYPENAMVTLNYCNNERGGSLFVDRVEICSMIDQ